MNKKLYNFIDGFNALQDNKKEYKKLDMDTTRLDAEIKRIKQEIKIILKS